MFVLFNVNSRSLVKFAIYRFNHFLALSDPGALRYLISIFSHTKFKYSFFLWNITNNAYKIMSQSYDIYHYQTIVYTSDNKNTESLPLSTAGLPRV